MTANFRAGDILLVRSSGWVGGVIRRLTRNGRERETMVNHAGIFVSENMVVEALTTGVVRRHVVEMLSAYEGHQVAVYRPRNVPQPVLDAIRARAELDVGRPYGFLKIATHALDWCLGGCYFFRRLTQADRFPICSWIVAKAYSYAGLEFGVPAGAASPDDIWDFVTSNPDKYEVVVPLSSVGAVP